jgi:Transposase DDE domain
VEPTAFDREVLRRLPLAEAVLLLLRQATLPRDCLDLFDRLRDRCYQRAIPFDLFVGLIRDALLTYHGSGRRAFAQARLEGRLTASNQAAYGKLSRVPLPLSEALLAENTRRLLPLLPVGLPPTLPPCLRPFRVLVVDGKVTKRVAKRLKVLRPLTGGALGGKGLAVLDQNSGLVLALAASADGHTNDAALVPAVLDVTGPLVPAAQTVLWVADSQFCDLTQPHRFVTGRGQADHFLLRYNAKVPFTPVSDAAAGFPTAARHGVEEAGRSWWQEWGWLGAAANPKRAYVRRIGVRRPGEKDVLVVTDLLDPAAYPAAELLQAYRQRGGVEGVFQKITEVFSLDKLIACRPKGTVFQLCFCLLLYNLLQVVRGYVAAGQSLAAQDVSAELLLEDVQRDLTALAEVVRPEAVAGLVPEAVTAAQVRARLGVLLTGLWKPIWRKAVNKKRRAHPNKPRARGHSSVQRVLESHNHQKASSLAPLRC